METFFAKWPKAGKLLEQDPKKLGDRLLDIAKECRQYGGIFHPDAVNNIALGYWSLLPSQASTYAVFQQGPAHDGEHYPADMKPSLEQHLARVWAHLESEGDVVPAPGENGRNGWLMFSLQIEKEIREEEAEAEQPPEQGAPPGQPPQQPGQPPTQPGTPPSRPQPQPPDRPTQPPPSVGGGPAHHGGPGHR